MYSKVHTASFILLIGSIFFSCNFFSKESAITNDLTMVIREENSLESPKISINNAEKKEATMGNQSTENLDNAVKTGDSPKENQGINTKEETYSEEEEFLNDEVDIINPSHKEKRKTNSKKNTPIEILKGGEKILITFLLPIFLIMMSGYIYVQYKKKDSYNNEFYSLLEKDLSPQASPEEIRQAKLITDFSRAILYLQYEINSNKINPEKMTDRLLQIWNLVFPSTAIAGSSDISILGVDQFFQATNGDIENDIKKTIIIIFYTFDVPPLNKDLFKTELDKITDNRDKIKVTWKKIQDYLAKARSDQNEKNYLDVLAISNNLRFIQDVDKTYGQFAPIENCSAIYELLAIQDLLALLFTGGIKSIIAQNKFDISTELTMEKIQGLIMQANQKNKDCMISPITVADIVVMKLKNWGNSLFSS